MAILLSNLLTQFIAILLVLIVVIITYYKWAFKYWKRRNIPYINPSIPFGTLLNPFRPTETFSEAIRIHYEKSKRKGLKHVGLFSLAFPVYMPIDLEYIKNIVSKDFHHFVDRGIYFNEKDDPISAHIFALEGARWKNLRMKLTPTFTSGKMKMMFNMLLECGQQLTDAVEKNFMEHAPVDIKDLSGCYTSDVIGTCAFGIECNSFKNPNSDFRRYARRFFTPTVFDSLRGLFTFTNPTISHMLRIKCISKEVSAFFTQIVKDTVDYRETTKTNRNDFMQLLMELKNNCDKKAVNKDTHLTVEEITAQAFLFFVAGFETSSSTMSFCLFELAQNLNIQEKMRNEIYSVLGEQKELTYDAIKEMKYMKQVIDEVLRKYSPLPLLFRKCVLDYKIPNTDLILKKGTGVFIPLLGLHLDPEYFPEPEKFDPDRFSPENRNNIKPFTYMPFGEGPRLCIGMRFGLMQTQVGLALLLRKFRFTLNKKTKLPLKLDPKHFTLTVLGDIWLNVEET